MWVREQQSKCPEVDYETKLKLKLLLIKNSLFEAAANILFFVKGVSPYPFRIYAAFEVISKTTCLAYITQTVSKLFKVLK